MAYDDDAQSLAAYGQTIAGAKNNGLATQGSAKLRPISWNGRLPYSVSNGTNTWANNQFVHNVQVPAPGFRLRYLNAIQDGAPAASGEQSATLLPSTIQIRAAALKLFSSGTISSPTATGCTLSTGYPNINLGGKLIVITNLANGQQSKFITTSSGNTITVASWLGGTPTTGASYRIYDWVPVTFNGQRTCTLDAHALVDCDFVPMPCLAGEKIFIVTNTFCASGTWAGAIMPTNILSYDGWTNTGTGSNVDATGESATGAWSTSASSIAAAPIAVLANVAEGLAPSLSFIGNSIAYGTGPSSDAVYGYNIGSRLLVSAGLPGWTGGCPGENTYGAVQIRNSRIRMMMSACCQYTYVEWGVNDNNGVNNFTLAATQANLLAIWARLAATGTKVIQRIPTPCAATSTDGWTSVANQTVMANPYLAGWQAVNSWLRDTSASGAVAQSGGTLWKVFDTSPYQESAVNSGKWAPATLLGSFTVASAASGGNIVVAGTPFASTYVDVTNNPDRYQVKLTSGAGVFTSGLTGSSGKNATINNVGGGGNQLNMNSAFTTTPSAGDTFDVWTHITADGTHPTRWAIERENNGFIATILPQMKALV